MMLSDYLFNGPVPVANKIHEAIVEGNQVSCNYLWCDYVETFDSEEDALTAAEIHESQKETY